MEVVVRAQKLDIVPRDSYKVDEAVNAFFGMIQARSYMGGEVSYFVELENGTVIHVIGIVKTKPFRREDPVAVTVPPRHCKLLRKES